jgi:hypothetical protein
MNLYEYVRSAPVGHTDPTGLWGKDFHEDLTLELAKKAGIACAADVAEGCERPDKDKRDAPSSFAGAQLLRAAAGRSTMAYDFAGAQQYKDWADEAIKRAVEWHFPADPNGVVHPDSTAANAKVNTGITDCNFKLFSEGLHTLQDSWAHQGKPFMEGLGHARGAEFVDRHTIYYPSPYPGWMQVWEPAHWEKLSGTLAAGSPSADDVTIWPKDARAAAIATYMKMLAFKKNCPCDCPGPNDTKVKTSSGDAEKEGSVGDWLKNTKFPGDNKVK